MEIRANRKTYAGDYYCHMAYADRGCTNRACSFPKRYCDQLRWKFRRRDEFLDLLYRHQLGNTIAKEIEDVRFRPNTD